MKIHTLKTWPEPFRAVVDGRKTWEFRKNDRDFREGDIVRLGEWDPTTEEYTCRSSSHQVGYILTSGFGLPEGYCIFSLEKIKAYWEE